MNIRIVDNNNNELQAASVNGFFRLYQGSNRVPYNGPVKFIADGPGDNCNAKGVIPHFVMMPYVDIQGFKEFGEYHHETLKVALNFEDTLPEGTCSSEKLFIYCRDAVIACEYHLEDGWIIDAIIEVPFVQAY